MARNDIIMALGLTAIIGLAACGKDGKSSRRSASASADAVEEAAPAPEAPAADSPVPPAPRIDPGQEAPADELAALLGGNPDAPAFGVVTEGTKVGDCTAGRDFVVRFAGLSADGRTATVDYVCSAGADIKEGRTQLALGSEVTYRRHNVAQIASDIKAIADTAKSTADNAEVDLAAQTGPETNGPCSVQGITITASRDPKSMLKCKEQKPVSQEEIVQLARRAQELGKKIYDQALAHYLWAQATIASLQTSQAGLSAQLWAAWIYIKYDPAFKGGGINGHINPDNRSDGADALLRYIALLAHRASGSYADQINALSQIQPLSMNDARARANAQLVSYCLMPRGILSRNGAAGNGTLYGLALKTIGADFARVWVYVDDLVMQQDQAWGHEALPLERGNSTGYEDSVDVNYIPLSDVLPDRTQGLGVPIVTFVIQPLDYKKSRAKQSLCTLQVGLQ